MNQPKQSQAFYEIRIEGELGDIWINWFEGLSIRKEQNGESHLPITILYGPIPDQPALFGVLNKIRDLNLTLISIEKYKPK